MRPDSIVLGAAGFVGRPLVEELLRRGHTVAAAVRAGGHRLAPHDRLRIVTADVTRPGLGLPQDDLTEVRDVYNTAARFAFGLGIEEARAVNVTGALHVLDWAATRPDLRRVVHVSGYRVSGPLDHPALGAYETSKREGDAAVRRRAAERGIPLTVANPATVIGPGQFIGLASVVSDLWRGRLRAVPGGPDVFVPVVELGYFAAFLADLPAAEESAGRSYWVLDDATPPLPGLVELLAGHLGVRKPSRTIPVGLLRRLPRAITGVEPETLPFLSTDRYDTAPARAVARRPMPPVGPALRRWADDLVAAGFGTLPPPARPYGFERVAGSATWVTGERARPSHVLLHGLPLDSTSWSPVMDRLDGPALAADLPGLGRSSPSPAAPHDWLTELFRTIESRPVLVAHSAACAPAVRFAAAHPDRVSRLVLVAPGFLQPPARWPLRSPLAAPVLRRLSAARLARALGVPDGPAIASAAANLARPGVARRVVGVLRARDRVGPVLPRVEVPVEIVAGTEDAPLASTDRPVTPIEGAGHYPQLTHPDELARVLTCEPSVLDR